MKTIKGGNRLVTQVEDSALQYDFHPYLISGGDVTYNVLTGETVRGIDIKEDREDLIRKWFMAPVGMDLNSLVYYLRQTMRPASTFVNDYTIFTTVKCNASCPYCFQHGGEDSSMGSEVAKDVASYILNNSDKSRRITIRWFGGEPLLNKEAINIISKVLRNASINFVSSMSTNGELLPDVLDSELYLWNLKNVQLTLDDSYENYDMSKGLPKGAYERLKESIVRLESFDIFANIRLHYHPELGLDTALRIVEDFKGYKNVRMYPAMIYGPKRTKEDYENLYILDTAILEAGLSKFDIMSSPRTHYCMADDERSRCIRVDGSMTPCEHYFKGETVGTIYSNDRNLDLVKKWSSKRKFDKKCVGCPLYPSCDILSNCPSIGDCDEGYREYLIARIKRTLEGIGRNYHEQG